MKNPPVNAIGPRAGRSWITPLLAVGLLLLLGVLATGIVLTQQQAKDHVKSSFALRGESSAQFVSTYLSEQASRERDAAQRFLSPARVSPTRFGIVAASLGSAGALLLDGSGRVLDAAPLRPSLHGKRLSPAYSQLPEAARGRVGISGIVTSPITGAAVTAIAVPFRTAEGTRVLSADYPASGLALDALVDHTISYAQHHVFLLDASGHVIAASPRLLKPTLAQAFPRLAAASAHASLGPVPGARTPSTFTQAPVPGTSWRLLIAVPNSRLFASIAGWTLYIPWLIFALVTALAVLIVVLFARLIADRSRLRALSERMERTAQTDSLTGLFNRRALTEQMTRAAARARRHDEPLSVLMIDLDRFKQTNDGFGHEAGDQVLCTIADCLHEVLRTGDIFGRWGGDEFLVVLPKTDAEGALATAERLRRAASEIELAEIGLRDGVPLSVGTATGVHANPHDLVREADLALYEAKGVRPENDDGDRTPERLAT
ncbi:MAG TPA: sensor domain-containing diguanylate cyclase [Solirubrobacteraceae bacterium]|nr:sensor domain-containing diguanylate cyclase [Solirubrobacteraceae bacterium]